MRWASDTNTNEMIISRYQAPSFSGATGVQPAVWAGYTQAREKVAMFSANQMNPATSNQPTNNGIQRSRRNETKWMRVRRNSRTVAANRPRRISGSQ